MITRRFLSAALVPTLVAIGNAFVTPASRTRRLVSLGESAEERDPYPSTPDGLPAEVEPVRTIGGGADMIFEMARQMLLWDETGEDSIAPPAATSTPPSEPPKAKETQKKPFVLPRWRPIRGVSDANPAFRTTAPMMNSQGYAGWFYVMYFFGKNDRLCSF